MGHLKNELLLSLMREDIKNIIREEVGIPEKQLNKMVDKILRSMSDTAEKASK